MAPRKQRIAVVLDTNVLVSFYLGRKRDSAAARIIRLWRENRALQLVVSEGVVDEYAEVLRRLKVNESLIVRFIERLESRETVTWVNLGPRVEASRDPDDNVFLSTAKSGRAAYVVSNDRDLLDIPHQERRRWRFSIVSPKQFLTELDSN
ncbi:MAG: putative toxin-antitoxin system toxin component, PIN family [Planctomycetales bacterium]|nr:putative toxin-antitoxin system toxin component, PIN family [Planctomycetales bacterium]